MLLTATTPLTLGGPAIPNAQIMELAECFPTPFYLYDLDLLGQRVDLLRAALPEGSDLYYSLKANPHPAVVGRFAALGTGLEVVSEGELRTALTCGIPSERIICIGPGKTRSFIALAVASGIGAIVAESQRDLRIAREEAAVRDRAEVPVWLRLDPGRGRARVCTSGETQFGLPLPEAVVQASTLVQDRRLRLTGLHAYLGTGVSTLEDLVTNTELALKAMGRVLEEADITTVKVLDVGGGFGIPYFQGETTPDWSRLRTCLAEPLAKARQRLAAGGRLAFESGRFLSGPAGLFVTRVLDCKPVGDTWFVILDGGTNVFPGYGGPFGKRAGPFYCLDVEGPEITATLCGPLCTTADRLATGVSLPRPREGDLIVFYQAGAYGRSAAPGLFLSHGFAREICLSQGQPLEGKDAHG